jgi:hypothetical protein
VERHYLSEIKKLQLSPQAVPGSVFDEIASIEKHNKAILKKIYKLHGISWRTRSKKKIHFFDRWDPVQIFAYKGILRLSKRKFSSAFPYQRIYSLLF